MVMQEAQTRMPSDFTSCTKGVTTDMTIAFTILSLSWPILKM